MADKIKDEYNQALEDRDELLGAPGVKDRTVAEAKASREQHKERSALAERKLPTREEAVAEAMAESTAPPTDLEGEQQVEAVSEEPLEEDDTSNLLNQLLGGVPVEDVSIPPDQRLRRDAAVKEAMREWGLED